MVFRMEPVASHGSKRLSRTPFGLWVGLAEAIHQHEVPTVLVHLRPGYVRIVRRGGQTRSRCHLIRAHQRTYLIRGRIQELNHPRHGKIKTLRRQTEIKPRSVGSNLHILAARGWYSEDTRLAEFHVIEIIVV